MSHPNPSNESDGKVAPDSWIPPQSTIGPESESKLDLLAELSQKNDFPTWYVTAERSYASSQNRYESYRKKNGRYDWHTQGGDDKCEAERGPLRMAAKGDSAAYWSILKSMESFLSGGGFSSGCRKDRRGLQESRLALMIVRCVPRARYPGRGGFRRFPEVKDYPLRYDHGLGPQDFGLRSMQHFMIATL